MKNFSYLNPKLAIQRSAIDRSGVIAKKTIPAGELVAIFGGRIITNDEADKSAAVYRNYETEVFPGFYIIGGGPSDPDICDFFNHSCNPNIGYHGQIVIVAMLEIKKGEEAVFDYAMSETDPGWNMTCRCGAPNCRKTINGNDWQKQELQKRYAGFFALHVAEKIAAP